MMLQIVTSLTIITYDRIMLVVKATREGYQYKVVWAELSTLSYTGLITEQTTHYYLTYSHI
jgi:hypothetical protein